MSRHYICLTVDTDPDNLSAYQPDRRTLEWLGLDYAIAVFPEQLSAYPLTWYIRADGQLEHAYGTVRYLFDHHRAFWQAAVQRGDALGWHPHLYTIPTDDSAPQLIQDSDRAIRALTHIWQHLQGMDLPLSAFRMGEGWQSAETLNLLESWGFTIDSSAIPERDDRASGHPRHWHGTPNQPYFPDKQVPRLAGTPRHLLEMPMNSWRFRASYDRVPKLRYMNPCIHSTLWQQALTAWRDALPDAACCVWVLILHPIESMARPKADLLYAHSMTTLKQNLDLLADTLIAQGHEVTFATMPEAARAWRTAQPTSLDE